MGNGLWFELSGVSRNLVFEKYVFWDRGFLARVSMRYAPIAQLQQVETVVCSGAV